MNPDLPSQQRSFAAFARETSDDPCAGTTAGDPGKVALGALETQLEELDVQCLGKGIWEWKTVGFYGEDVFHDMEHICLISRDEEII